MNHLEMGFATETSNSTNYSLTCTNNSSIDWVFYMYQEMPNQSSDLFSLAWFASPYKISPGSRITFTWNLDYSFAWANTGQISPGVTFNAGGLKSCDLNGANTTTFSLDNNAPQLSNPTEGGQLGSLTVNTASNIPNGTFSTGIGMSGQSTFVQQAYANTTQTFIPKTEYWIGAATQMQMGQVLSQTNNQAISFKFPSNVYALNATLNENNTWSIN